MLYLVHLPFLKTIHPIDTAYRRRMHAIKIKNSVDDVYFVMTTEPEIKLGVGRGLGFFRKQVFVSTDLVKDLTPHYGQALSENWILQHTFDSFFNERYA